MGIKDNPFRQSADGELEKKVNNLWRQRINNFLINYFGSLALALALIIFAVGLFLYVYPKYQQLIKGNDAAKKQQQAEYKIKFGYLAAVNDLKNSYQSISAADKEKVEAMVPVNGQAIGLISEIEAIALKNGVTLNYVKIAEDPTGQPGAKIKVESGEKSGAPAGSFNKLPAGVGLTKMEISLSSVNYAVLKNLLKVFESNLRLLDLAEINYDVSGKRVTLTVYAYYLIRWNINLC